MNLSIIAASRLRNLINPMFQNAVAYYRFDETAGDAIDLVNGYNGVLNGAVSRNGSFYTFDNTNEWVQLADQNDFSFTDGAGNNTDFVIKTEVIFDALNSQNRAWLVSKRQSTAGGIQEWQLVLFNNFFSFYIYSSSNSLFIIEVNFTPTLGQKYILGVTMNGNILNLFIDGAIVRTQSLPAGFTFFNGTSVVKIANETFIANLNLLGKIKETVIVKGSGWTAQNITDNYNGGAGITY
jgi:hypothetical protein